VLTPGVAAEPRPAAPPLVLALGGQRSGKSSWAERRVAATGLAPVYVATAEARDDEMRARIAHHRARRGDDWAVVEAPLELAAAIADAGTHGRALLVDCLTLWLSNLLVAERDVAAAVDELEAALAARRGPVVLVSNEVGSGVIPTNALARRFVDEAGRLHQRLAAGATEVVLVTAGLVQTLKAGSGEDRPESRPHPPPAGG
jgi:adenosylcobinamide kinase/adenosylcobinamide-phosphate guanylyltransferase